MFFANDSLLFCRAERQECTKLVEILKLYEAALGQKVNADKSAMNFNHNTTPEARSEVLEILGPMQDTRQGKYLGLPSVISKSKNQVFAKIKERVGKKLSGWKEKMLSMGGKEILIKAVTRAIPTYTISCFLLPKGLCEDLKGMERNFWWGQKDQETKMSWVSWRKMCMSKTHGGTGLSQSPCLQLGNVSKASMAHFG